MKTGPRRTLFPIAAGVAIVTTLALAGCGESETSAGSGTQGGADTPVSTGTTAARASTARPGGAQGGADDSACTNAGRGQAAASATAARTGTVADATTARETGTATVAATRTPSMTPAAAGTGTPSGSPAAGSSPVAMPALKDPALRVQRIDGLESPTQVAFLGPNDLLVTEKAGKVVRVTDGRITGTVLELSANSADERGVLGITLHPEFRSNGFVYMYWTWTGEGGVPRGLTGKPSTDIEKVPANGNRVDRFRWDGSRLAFDCNVIELPSRTTDLTLNRRRGNHNAGVMTFGPDGKLYVVIGDQNVRGHLTNVRDGPDLSQSGLVGVMLRLNDDGSTPQDNPFASQGAEPGRIWLYGIRNSFGFDFDPKSGGLWLQVNGQASYDEIGRYEAGDNIGWVQVMGPPERFDDYKRLEIDTERKLDAKEFPPERLAASGQEALSRLVMLPGARYNPPEFSWRYAVAPAGFGFIDGAALGADYDGDLLVGDVNTGNIWRFKLASDRNSFALSGGLADKVNDNDKGDLTGEMKDSLFATGFLVATDIEQGPDGTLWITSAGSNALYHITRSGP